MYGVQDVMHGVSNPIYYVAQPHGWSLEPQKRSNKPHTRSWERHRWGFLVVWIGFEGFNLCGNVKLWGILYILASLK